jgi:hypothetical protein
MDPFPQQSAEGMLPLNKIEAKAIAVQSEKITLII